MDNVFKYIKENKDRFLEELIEFCRFDSVSADPLRKHRMVDCANWLSDHLKGIGISEVFVIPNEGHPVVYAEHKVSDDAKTLLVYGHYDVQPEDPIDLWDSPPFEPTIRNGALYARGTADDKGQLFVYLKALEAYIKTGTRIPVNIKMIIEGEEEISSPNLVWFVKENKNRLACDAVAVSDSSMIGRGKPAITIGLRGLTYMQIDIQAAKGDLHSGSFGGGVANPANVLAKMIASMKDENNKVTIDGFYDDVVELTPKEKEAIAKLPHDDRQWLESVGAPALEGEAGYSTLERISTRPTLDVNGMWSGFMGEGAKTVLPAKAGAKISMRLVPNQDPKKIAALFEAHVKKACPESVTLKVTHFSGGKPFICPHADPYVKAASRALEKGFGTDVYYLWEGGSIPIVADFSEAFNAPILLLGYGVPDENAHAPNEFFLLENFYGGIRSTVYLFDEIDKL